MVKVKYLSEMAQENAPVDLERQNKYIFKVAILLQFKIYTLY